MPTKQKKKINTFCQLEVLELNYSNQTKSKLVTSLNPYES